MSDTIKVALFVQAIAIALFIVRLWNRQVQFEFRLTKHEEAVDKVRKSQRRANRRLRHMDFSFARLFDKYEAATDDDLDKAAEDDDEDED